MGERAEVGGEEGGGGRRGEKLTSIGERLSGAALRIQQQLLLVLKFQASI